MESYWLKQGNRVAARVNLARWLEWAAPGVAAWGVGAGCAFLLARRSGWDTRSIALSSAIILLLLVWVALRRARARWFSGADGLTRLDAVLGLNNRLSSAAAGVGDWPPATPAVASAKGRLRWRWDRVLFPPILGCAFLAAALLFPISVPVETAPLKIEEPLAWGEVEAALESLKKDEVADPESLAALEQKLEALRAQPEEAWYGQSSLEAGAALRQETGASISKLERQLDAAGQALAQMNGSPSSAEAAAQWAEALRGLEAGALPMEGSQLAKLKDFKPGAGQFSAEQLQQMLQELSENAGEASKRLGSVSDAIKGAFVEGEGEGSSGGPGPGGGHEPLGLKSAPTALQPATEEALPQGDAGRAALGDVVKRSAQAPEFDPSQVAGPTDAGGIGSSGAGGEAVWKSEITPAERSVLRRFFK